MRRFALLCAAVALLPGCFGPDPNVTETGKGRPIVSVGFAAQSAAGSVSTATVRVRNPGPGDMARIVVAFAYVGPAAGGEELPTPIVGPALRRKLSAVVKVHPEPRARSRDRVVYVFDGLAEGESAILHFDLRVPDEPGIAANSVTVYDGDDPERAAGGRLETLVRRD